MKLPRGTVVPSLTAAPPPSGPSVSVPQLVSPTRPVFYWVGADCWWASSGHSNRTSDTALIPKYVEALARAERRVLIMDAFFEREPAFAAHQSILQAVAARHCDVRILTGRYTKMPRNPKDGLPLGIKIADLQRAAIGIHDRFVLVDDDLWHFGANVGGTHRDTNAATQGWFNEAIEFAKLFEACWRTANV